MDEILYFTALFPVALTLFTLLGTQLTCTRSRIDRQLSRQRAADRRVPCDAATCRPPVSYAQPVDR